MQLSGDKINLVSPITKMAPTPYQPDYLPHVIKKKKDSLVPILVIGALILFFVSKKG